MNEFELYLKAMELQKQTNDYVNQQVELLMMQNQILVKRIEFLLKVAEDHEKDMERMAEEINKLKKQLSDNE